MSLRERISKNVTRASAKIEDSEQLAFATELVRRGLRASAVVTLTGMPPHTVKILTDRDVGARKSGRQPGSIERLQDDSHLRLHCSVFVHAYLKAREVAEPFYDSRPFVRALRTLEARSPEHGISADLFFYALQQYQEGVLALERCLSCGAHYLRITQLKDAKRKLEGDCFICTYRFRQPGRTASLTGKELIALALKQPG
ncbi:FlhC family transcriptional regulator [Ahniella affigens]|uniref:FlhC family transcriptional regulator n=1 Tax=Ahniella affigens TaxID=2021234 RepID=UPI00147418FC|nr:FlhC family transcriptional regulator [Ahniella affigens]